MATAYLGLGSNLGDRERYLRFALEELGRLESTRIVSTSSLYCSKAWGKTDQPDFMNMVAEIDTGLESLPLLAECKRIEGRAGRTAGERWGPRVLDIDILLYGTELISLPNLVVPHARMLERRFVIEPLAELQPKREMLWFFPDDMTLEKLLESAEIRSQEVWPCGKLESKGVDEDSKAQ